MRYSIEWEVLDKKHPLWPNEKVYYIYDHVNRRKSWSCYTSLEAANEMLKLKDV